MQRGGNHALISRSVALQPHVIDWLMDEGFEMAPGMPQIFHGHEAYSIPRTYWGVDRGLSILAVLRRALDPLLAEGLVELRLNTRSAALLSDDDGVVGIETTDGQSSGVRSDNRVAEYPMFSVPLLPTPYAHLSQTLTHPNGNLFHWPCFG